METDRTEYYRSTRMVYWVGVQSNGTCGLLYKSATGYKTGQVDYVGWRAVNLVRYTIGKTLQVYFHATKKLTKERFLTAK